MVELLQLQADEGPCVDCFRTGAPVSVADLADAAAGGRVSSPRWPSASPTARCTRCRCGCAGEAIGTLNLFHHQPGPLPAADLALGQALADVATIGILSERAIRRGEMVTEQLQTALNSRIIIEQAKGVLAQRGNLSMDAAFDRLRGYARHHNLRLSEVARQVVDDRPRRRRARHPRHHPGTRGEKGGSPGVTSLRT